MNSIMMDPAQGLPWNSEWLPRLYVAGSFPLSDEGFGHNYFNPRLHALHQHEYRGRIRIDGREHALEPGDLTLTPRASDNRYDLDAPGRHLCVHFAPCRGRRAGRLWLPLHLRPGPVEAERFRRQLREIATALAEHEPPGRAWARAALQELLLRMARLARSEAPEEGIDGAVERARLWLLEHLDEPLDVPALARRVGYSQNYLALHFRRRTGMTLARYQAGRRIEQACLLLEQTQLPVKVIGARVGLADAQHFNKLFRRERGRSPAAWRRRGSG